MMKRMFGCFGDAAMAGSGKNYPVSMGHAFGEYIGKYAVSGLGGTT
jgi:hypothetical protein